MNKTQLTSAIEKLQEEMRGWTSDINVYAAYQRNIAFLISLLPKEREDMQNICERTFALTKTYKDETDNEITNMVISEYSQYKTNSNG